MTSLLLVLIPALFHCALSSEHLALNATPLNEWPMLMSHDAATGYLTDRLNPVYAWTRTQPASPAAFANQLGCGARAFDFRAHVSPAGQLIFHHGDVQVGHDARTALVEIVQWANAHPQMEDLVVMYNWDCTGLDCPVKMAQVLAEAGVQTVSDCGTVASLTLEGAAAKAALKGGGHVLVVQGNCVDKNYDETLACSGFDGPRSQSSLTAPTVQDHCAHLPAGSSFEVHSVCGDQLREKLDDVSGDTNRLSLRRPRMAGYYTCWEGGIARDFPVKRLLDSLTRVSSQKPPPGRLSTLQALWQETSNSVVIGVAHFSSLLKDEEKSKLNMLMVEQINSGVFKYINFLEVNNVCDHGPELRQALLAHHKRKMLADQQSSFMQARKLRSKESDIVSGDIVI